MAKRQSYTQWRTLRGIVALNSFISMINPVVDKPVPSEKCSSLLTHQRKRRAPGLSCYLNPVSALCFMPWLAHWLCCHHSPLSSAPRTTHGHSPNSPQNLETDSEAMFNPLISSSCKTHRPNDSAFGRISYSVTAVQSRASRFSDCSRFSKAKKKSLRHTKK